MLKFFLYVALPVLTLVFVLVLSSRDVVRQRQRIRRRSVEGYGRLPRDPNEKLQYRRYQNGTQQDPRD
jgi:hypothetical protein